MIRQELVPKAIHSRNVAFETTEELLEELKRTGASDEVIQAIRAVRPPKPPPAPPPPPKPVTGALTVRCAPAECMVEVLGGPSGNTKSGVYRAELPLRGYTVRVSKPGYSRQEQVVTQLTEAGAALAFKLELDAATKARIGSDLVQLMLRAHGTYAAPVGAKGSWTRSAAGFPEERTFVLRWSPKEMLLFLVSQPGWFQLQCQGETCHPTKDKVQAFQALRRGKELRDDNAARAERELRYFRRRLLPNVIEEIRTGVTSGRFRPTAESESAGADGHYRVRLETNDERYLLELDGKYLLVELTHDFGPKLDRSETASYSDYVDVGPGKHPRRTQVKAATDEHGFLQVRFDTISTAAN
jgi:hypothetical protein